MRESNFKSYDDLPLMLSAPEVAEVLDTSRAGAYELVSSAGFTHMKIRNQILVSKDKFLRRIDEQPEEGRIASVYMGSAPAETKHKV